ncbi:hypothetical protein GCM10020000_52090 [Streptomyces olivoverticillatus]
MRGERLHHAAGDVELGLGPLDADGRVLRRHFERARDLGPGELAGGLQPPQRQRVLLAVVEPAGCLGDVLALALEAEPDDGEVDEVGLRVGDFADLLQSTDGGRPDAPPDSGCVSGSW